MSSQTVSFDPSQSYQPVQAGGFDPNASYAPATEVQKPEAPPTVGQVLAQDRDKTDKEYLNYRGAAGVAGATIHGLNNVGRDTIGAIKGAWDTLTAPPQDDSEKAVGLAGPVALPLYRTLKQLGHSASDATQIVGAIHDINQSPDPTGHYLNAAEDTASQGAGQALATLGTAGVSESIPEIRAAVPSTERAGAALQDIKSTVGDVPINTAKPGNTALDIYTQSQRGATLPSSVGKLVRRLTAPDSPPMTYAEAKDFQSNISKLSADEQMKLNPNTRRLVGKLNQDLKSSLEDAADTAGKGQQFQDAMKEYHNAMRIKGWSESAIDAAWKAALTGAGIYGIGKIFGLAKPSEF